LAEIRERPKTLPSKSYKEEVGCGSLYVTVSKHNGEIIEVYATLGKSGGCSMCQNSALCRSISVGLRSGVPAQRFVKILKGMRCPNPVPGLDENYSCADAIGRVLEKEINDDGTKGKGA